MTIAEQYREIYDRTKNPGYCCLHIVIDDGNVEDGHVRWCLENAASKKHADCEELARFLLTLCPSERLSVVAPGAVYYEGDEEDND